ncbi:SDR family oxidoreductase [Micromonospora sp. WMMB482]|nr:SDR family oxidoreductase [Micromonospora sp. WMMB482]
MLVTDAADFLGPAVVRRFRHDGAEVTAVTSRLRSRAEADRLAAEHGPFDVVVANLETAITVAPTTAHTNTQWSAAFDELVHPLFWLLAACLPGMIQAGGGSVVVPTSATALRTSSHPIVAYEAARAAQVAIVRSVGWEVAGQGVRVNGIAPNFIENPSYFPPETAADPEFQQELRRVVPARRLGGADEAADVIAWLASASASYVVGAVIPVDGGWTLG